MKRERWYQVAVGLTAINLVGVGFAVGPGQPWHAAIHAALALVCGLWAQRLRQGRGESELQGRLQGLDAEVSRLEAVEADVNKLRQELNEAQERLDFAERLLARRPDARKG